MGRTAILTLLTAALLCSPAVAHETGEYHRPNYADQRLFTGSVQVGYFNGMGLHFAGTFDNFAGGFPFALRFGLGHTWGDAGDPLLARRVFIDNATNGTPQEYGTMWEARFDLMHGLKLFSMERNKIFAGVRWAKYSGYFEYTGANETFNAEGYAWGLGAGLETAFAISPIMDMTFTLGFDNYFKGELYGHGSRYRPNGDDIDPTGSYTWADADAAVNQPTFNTRIMMGLAYRF